MLTRIDDRQECDTFLNTRVEPHIRVVNGVLDEDTQSSSGIVLNGRIDTNCLRFLKVDSDYQRPLNDRSDIFEALKSGAVVPNIDIGVRGQDFTTDGDDYVIRSPAYIIDGWQRVGNAIRLLELIPQQPLRIFATIHFGTDAVWERHRFTELNKNVRKVSPNLHLRNMRDQNEAVLTLYGLSNNTKNFPLYKKVSWSQSMERGQLMTALVLCKAAMTLHGHKASLKSGSAANVADALKKCAASVTLNNFRHNVAAFISIINEAWPIGAIEYRRAAPQIKSSFVIELARLFSNHSVFWTADDRMFNVAADDRKKLSKFPISDPQVINLAGAGGTSRKILYHLLFNHMNSGRRTHRLISRFDHSEIAA